VRAPRAYVEAAERWGYLAEAQARRYGVANGATLLLKIVSGESGFNMRAVSSADARGAAQFIPSTRDAYVRRYGVDPWKSPEEAIHAAAIYMHTSGLVAYNPGGGQAYIDYILGQDVQAAGSGRAFGRGGARSRSHEDSGGGLPGGLAGDLMHIGLTATLVLGGGALVALGTTRVLGTASGRRQA